MDMHKHTNQGIYPEKMHTYGNKPMTGWGGDLSGTKKTKYGACCHGNQGAKGKSVTVIFFA